MKESFYILVNKLNKFKRKYYLLKIIRGILITLLISLLIFTLISIIEYFAFLSSSARTFIFFSSIILFVLLFIQFIIIPLFQLISITNQISYKGINNIIVKHFPEIKDKLLNILELTKIDDSNYSNDIIWASIDQKINKIKVFNFQNAVNFRQLRFILVYLLVCIGIISGILIFDKPLITESNYRIYNYKETFIKPAPFKYILENEDLNINKGDAFTINLKCEGDNLPQVVYINIAGNNFLMNRTDNNHFKYNIESVINSFEFYFSDLKYFSETYNLQILPKPGIYDFSLKIQAPKYTNTGDKIVENTGDIKVPAGSELEWNFNCIDTDSLYILFNNTDKLFAISNNNVFKINKRITENTSYNIYLKNSYVDYSEVLSYSVSVISDLFPDIKVVQTRDSIQYSRFYFKGSIADDYGFTSLNFHYNINNKDSIIPLDVLYNLSNQDFYYTIDFNDFDNGNEEISYYFSVSDNDQINGYKTKTSNSFTYINPSNKEIENHDNEQFAQIEDYFNESTDLVKDIKEGLKELQRKNLDVNVSDWEKSQLINEIVTKKNELEKIFDKVEKQNSDLNKFMNSFTEQNEEIVKKQTQLEELLDEVFTDELKELMDEFSKLAQEFNEKDFNKLSEELDMSFEDLSKQLDRNLEMLRKLKVEQKLQAIIDKIYELGDDEEKLAFEINEKKNYTDILQKDSENKDELNELQNNLNDALELNNELKKPLNYDDFDNEFNNINESFDNNKENLEKKRRKKSSQGIRNTSEQLKGLAFSMDQLLKSNIMKQNMESIENIRQILSNLIYFSFSQEDIMAQLSGISISDPVLGLLKRDQKNLIDQSTVLNDSLYALANRTPQITNMIGSELFDLELNLGKSMENMEEGLIPNSGINQQFVITAVNNLALLLNDALDRLEEQMANSMEGDQECENPNGKGGKNGMDMLKNQSESLKQQLQKMIEEMKKGNSKNMSKMLGKSLMQHEMMQQMLRELMNNGSVGSDARKQLQNIDKILEQNRKDLINKNVSQRTLMRQNQILSRLLEAEKAENERDIDNKRESKTADKIFYSNPVKYFEYNKESEKGLENLEHNVFKLNNFYSKKHKKYLNIINEQADTK